MFKCIAGIITEDNVVIICSLCVGGKAFILVLLLQNVFNYLVFVDVYTQGVWGGVCVLFFTAISLRERIFCLVWRQLDFY